MGDCMKKLLLLLLKQKNIGVWLGGLKHAMGQVGMYVSFMNLFMLAITTYNTGWVQEYIIDVNFAQFMLIIIGIIGLLLIMVTKIDIPSYFGFWNSQFWSHQNPLRKEIEEIKKNQELIMKHLGIEDGGNIK